MLRRPVFVCFVGSGFCSLVYQVVWLRLAMAQFGVTTQVLSIVLSVFMGGLAIGSMVAGRWAAPRPPRSAFRAYAVAELVVGVSAFLVPVAFRSGGLVLMNLISSAAWGSTAYHAATACVIVLSLLPSCIAMGTTLPLGVAFLHDASRGTGPGAFSFLYLANVIGAALGTLTTALVLVEALGFTGTLLVAAAVNFLIALGAWWLSSWQAASPTSDPIDRRANVHRDTPSRAVPWLLFTTGLLSMAMEVVWVRQFTPYLGTEVYAFASILGLYLVATFLGSAVWRRASRQFAGERYLYLSLILGAAGAVALLPLIFADPNVLPSAGLSFGAIRVAGAIGPFCLVVGFLTPMLVDQWCRGDAARAGRAYAANVVGCIVGPLVAGFVLLPRMGERNALALLATPLLVVGFALAAFQVSGPRRVARARFAPHVLAAAAAALSFFGTRDFESVFPQRRVMRDHAATVIAAGDGLDKQLLVNGYGMTVLTPITKMMAHLPLAFHSAQPKNALVICLGMGTTFRSARSWGVDTTAVELIPSVASLVSYFHADISSLLARPGARIVVDDGRRYLERTTTLYDVVTVDPPPPVEAAGSSLLYSREFLRIVRGRLGHGGILQHWLPAADATVTAAVARALSESFLHVRAYRPEFGGGYHFLASDQPLPLQTAEGLADRLPALAASDMVEWQPGTTARQRFARVLSQEAPIGELVALSPDTPAMTDDQPLNEYYALRRLRDWFTDGQGTSGSRD